MPAASADTIIIGQTSRKVFWSVVLAGIFLMVTMVYALSSQLIALAVELPIDFTITASTINATKFSLMPGQSRADGKTPVAVVSMDAIITNQVISKSFPIPGGGHIILTITAGNKGTPVKVTGLSIDTTGLDAGNAVFTNLILSTGPNGSSGQTLTQTADSQMLTNATIEAPYLLASSITLPDLSLAISVGP